MKKIIDYVLYIVCTMQNIFEIILCVKIKLQEIKDEIVLIGCTNDVSYNIAYNKWKFKKILININLNIKLNK